MTMRMPIRRQAGLSLIELMVAMVLGLLVAAGIVSVFISTSSSNRAQNQLARLQEEGRFAITQLGQDLSQANGQYCTNSGGNAAQSATTGIYLDGLRAPMVYANDLLSAISDLSTRWGSPYPAQPAMPYYLPSFLSMRGYDCSAASCTPDPGGITNTSIPGVGKGVGQRVIGADVLSVRYVDASKGWALGGTSTIDANNVVSLVPGTNEPPVSRFRAGDLAMLADCSSAQVYAVDVSGGTLTPRKDTSNLGAPTPLASMQGAPRLFDFNQDFQTVTYYLKVVDGDGDGHLTGALIRRVNGVDNELVRGIERLDFRYGVERADGTTSYLTADQVDAAVGDQCPPSVPNALGTDAGCLWRAVKSIEVDILMDGQIPLFTLSQDEMQYTYASDATTAALAAPSAHALTPTQQGFTEPMIRREFTALVSVRNFNP